MSPTSTFQNRGKRAALTNAFVPQQDGPFRVQPPNKPLERSG
jgi:hypothetical protein